MIIIEGFIVMAVFFGLIALGVIFYCIGTFINAIRKWRKCP